MLKGMSVSNQFNIMFVVEISGGRFGKIHGCLEIQ